MRDLCPRVPRPRPLGSLAAVQRRARTRDSGTGDGRGAGGCNAPACRQPRGHERRGPGAAHGSSAFPHPAPSRQRLLRLPPARGPRCHPAPSGPFGRRVAERRSLGESWVGALCKAFPRYINASRRNARRSGTRSPGQHRGSEPPPASGPPLAAGLLRGPGPGGSGPLSGLKLPPLPGRSGPRFMQRWREMKAEERGLFSACTGRAWKQPALAAAGAGVRSPCPRGKGRVCTPGLSGLLSPLPGCSSSRGSAGPGGLFCGRRVFLLSSPGQARRAAEFSAPGALPAGPPRPGCSLPAARRSAGAAARQRDAEGARRGGRVPRRPGSSRRARDGRRCRWLRAGESRAPGGDRHTALTLRPPSRLGRCGCLIPPDSWYSCPCFKW